MAQVLAESPFQVGSVIDGKLRVVRLLGVGGMGAVCEVEHLLTHHRRALKVLHPDMAQSQSVVERFLREASAAGRIGNPHIVETYDVGYVESGEPYIVMELLRGRALADVLSDRGGLDVETTVRILTQACNGFAAAHAAGIIHRDIKPENLFLSGEDESFVKILDFGISKFEATTGVEGLTIEGTPMGTPYYMSPEQVRGEKDIDSRTDVYALGVVLYECLTGEKPFVAETLTHLAVLIHQGTYCPPAALRPTLPKIVDRIVAKAMAPNRADRYESIEEFSYALQRIKDSIAPEVMAETMLEDTAVPAPTARGVPALTPGVFSRPSHNQGGIAAPKQKGSLRALGAILAVGLGVVLLVFLLRNKPIEEGPAEPANTSSSPLVAAPERVTVTSASADVADAEALAASPTPSITISPSNSAIVRSALNTLHPPTQLKPDAAPGPTKPDATPLDPRLSRPRVSSHRLAEDNPFRYQANSHLHRV